MGETRKAYHLLRQAKMASDPYERLQVIRRMYQLRFAEPLDADLTLEQIRGKEGLRVRQAYARTSQETGVPWFGRRYDRKNWARGDPINRAISRPTLCSKVYSRQIEALTASSKCIFTYLLS